MTENEMYFENLDEALKFIKVLHENSINDSNHFNDIHTYEEETAIIVKWVQIPYDRDYGGEYRYVDEDEDVMVEFRFPDNHYEHFLSRKEAAAALQEWLKENPGWLENEYGIWHHVSEED
jgi:hypothetical protein